MFEGRVNENRIFKLEFEFLELEPEENILISFHGINKRRQ